MGTYSWDQSDKKLKFYLKGCKNINENNKISNSNDPCVKVIFDADDKISLLVISEKDKMEYNFNIPTLYSNIDQNSKQLIKVKKDYVFISLSKKSTGNWEFLTCKDKK